MESAKDSKKELGAPCINAEECASNFCTDERCCEAGCKSCQRCGEQGRCETITSGKDPDSCAGANSACSPSGACVRVNGASCSTGEGCLSGNCVDRFCCEAPMCGSCSSCGVDGHRGVCSPIAGTDDADSCSGTRTCGSSTKCLIIDDEQALGGLGYYVGDASEYLRIAQTVTIRSPGQLVEIRLSFWCKVQGEVLRATVNAVSSDGTPSATILSKTRLTESTFRIAPPDGEASFFNLPLDTPVSVKAGDRLALVAEAPGTTDECMLFAARTEAYPGGEQYRMPRADAPTWTRLDKDFAFQTLVER